MIEGGGLNFMKQHITVEQLNELSKKGQKRYVQWCIEKGYEHNSRCAEFSPQPDLLSIGQMIEFLREDWHILLQVGAQVSYRNKRNEPRRKHRPELCDALWEALKEVLEQRNNA